MAGDAPLELQTTYQVFCYAEDDWKIQAAPCNTWCLVSMNTFGQRRTAQADSASNSADYVSPAGLSATSNPHSTKWV